jgi:hypothetical protein
VKIAIVEPDKPCLEFERTIELRLVVHFWEHVHMQIMGSGVQGARLVV